MSKQHEPARGGIDVERNDPTECKRPTVRRKLFGSVDDLSNSTTTSSISNCTAALQENFENMLAESRNQDKEKWNFDFENEQPLDGQWQWEKLDNSNSSTVRGIESFACTNPTIVPVKTVNDVVISSKPTVPCVALVESNLATGKTVNGCAKGPS